MTFASTILRGPARGVMSSKRGNKNYYKGKGSGRLGTWTTRNKFILQPWKQRHFIIPDLNSFNLLPYVSPKATLISNHHGPSDYFLNDDLPLPFKTKCLQQASDAFKRSTQSNKSNSI